MSIVVWCPTLTPCHTCSYVVLCIINLERCKHAFAGHETHVHGVAWLSGNTLVSGDEKGWMVCHDLRSPQYAWRASISQHGVCSMSATPAVVESGTHELFLGLTKGFVCLYSPSEQRFLLPPTNVHKDDVRCVLSWENNSTSSKSAMRRKKVSLLTTSFDHTAAVWDIQLSSTAPDTVRAKGSHKQTFDCSLKRAATLINGHTDKILCATKFPHSDTIVTTGADGKAILWQK